MSDFAYKIELWTGTTLYEYLETKMKSCSWVYNRIGGCGDLTLVIDGLWTEYDSVNPSWDIKIQVRFTGEADFQQVYIGKVIGKTRVIDHPERIEFRAIGYVKQLEDVVIYRNIDTEEQINYSSMTIKEILADLFTNYITPYTDITYSSGDVDDPPITPEGIKFNTDGVGAIKLLATLAGNYEWGVNGTGAFYFKAKSTTRLFDFYPGENVKFFEAINDGSNIKNRIHLTGADDNFWILENATDQTAGAYQIYGWLPASFGKATTYQKLAQTFTRTERIKNILLSIGRQGFANLLTDGDMETAGTANWPDYNGPPSKSKKTDTPKEGTQYLKVFYYAVENTGVYQNLTLTGGGVYTLFLYGKVFHANYPMSVQIYNVTEAVEEYLKEDAITTTTWKSFTCGFTVTGVGAKTVSFRFYGKNTTEDYNRFFSLDDVRVTSQVDNVELSIVEWPALTEIKKVVIPGNLLQITASPGLVTNISLTIDSLTYGTTYAILLERSGTLDDTSYYVAMYNNLTNAYAYGELSYYNGAAFFNLNYDLQFIMYRSSSQGTYGIKSESIQNNSISYVEDAQLWTNAYLSQKISPINTGSLKVLDNSEWYEKTKPIGLLAVKREDGSDTNYDVKSIRYNLTNDDLEIDFELGMVFSKLSDYIGLIEYQLEQMKT